MKSFSDRIKSISIVCIVILLGISTAVRLMKIQIVGDEEIIPKPVYNVDDSYVYTKKTKATRGEIVDYYDDLIVTNTTSTNLILQYALFPKSNSQGNQVLLEIYNELKNRGYSIKQHIPVSDSAPYKFVENKDLCSVDRLISDLNINVYATAENCIDCLISQYEISDDYSDEEKRIIAGLRYELTYREFSYNNDFVLAENVDTDTVIEFKEMSNFLRGIDVSESAERKIIRGDILPHEIGVVGPIYAEEYEELKEQGYELNDTLGKNGIEYAMESVLRGQNGEDKITFSNGSISKIDTIAATRSGETVKLTVSGEYQKRLQSILDNFIANFQSINDNPVLNDVHSGAIAVLDTKTGSVRGLTTAPTYNLIDYQNDFESFLNAPNSPLVNRATYGLYRPGSTFKPITATAGLNEGIVTGETTFDCTHDYFYIDTHYQCTGYHNDISVTRAIEVSCNIYFYELSQRLGIDTITKYAQLYGLGQHTGIETGDAAGYLANPETFAANGQDWYIGYVLQAGIGNIDCGMTPLQMANVACTIANEGVRYKPYLVDSLYEYGTYNLNSKTKPTVAETIELKHDYVYDYIEAGMIAASHNMPAKYSISNLGFDVAIKTGTPQVGEHGEQNSFFIGYAPADNPEVAFAGVIEGGEYSKYMIRDILLAYQECYGLNGVGPTINTHNRVDHAAAIAATSVSSVTTTTVTSDAQPNNVPDNQTQTTVDSPVENQDVRETEPPQEDTTTSFEPNEYGDDTDTPPESTTETPLVQFEPTDLPEPFQPEPTDGNTEPEQYQEPPQ